jgi:hypothetical protein
MDTSSAGPRAIRNFPSDRCGVRYSGATQPAKQGGAMRVSRAVALTAFGVFLGCGAAAAHGQQPPMPKPGPEHEVFKSEAGVWDAVIESSPAPGAAPMTSKGVETSTLGCGGLCLITDFKGEMMPGTAFEGHGVAVWDPAKKKYVGSWTDSMSQGLMLSESTFDSAASRFTGEMEGPDSSGTVVKMRSTTEIKGDQRVFTLSGPGPDGKDMPMLKITYTKRK